VSLLPAAQLAGNSPQADLAAAHNNNSVSASTGTGYRESGSPSEFALPTHALAVSDPAGQSIPLAVSDPQANTITELSASGENAAAAGAATLAHTVPAVPAAGGDSLDASLNGLNPLSTAMVAGESASDYALGAASAVALQPVEAASAAERRGASGSRTSSELSAHSANPRASGADAATGLASHGLKLAQGNSALASSSIGPAGYSFASGSAPGTVPGSTLGSGPGSSGGATISSAAETFAALDGGAPAGSISWTHAGANRAEAGFEDPALGWVGVRADLGGGSVHASLVPGSAEAAQMLGSHLAGLNEYLAERHPTVVPVTVAGHESDGSSANAQAGSGTDSGTQSFNQQNSTSNANNGWTSTGSNPISFAGEGSVEAVSASLAFPGTNLATETMPGSSGSHISVMA